MIWLLASLAALVVGPLLLAAFGARRGVTSLLDGFVVVAVPGLIFLHFVPEAIEHLEWMPVLVLLAGFWLPVGAERLLRDPRGRTDQLALFLGVTGMAVHGLLDGAALPSVSSGGGDTAFGLAVVLHRVPVGLAIWWMVRSIVGRAHAVAAIGGLGAVTVVGWIGGAELSTVVGSRGVELYQALVGGSLIHVIFHRSSEFAPDSGGHRARSAEGAGALLALVLLGGIALFEGATGHHGGVEFLSRLFVLAAISAPALVIAYLAAGLLFAYMPAGSIRWMSRGSSPARAARGMAVGLPLPVCSCGVVPLYQTLVKRGAAPTAALAFLVATPELGLDAILLSIPLLGAEMTGIRVAAAAMAALLVGWWVGAWIERRAAGAIDAELTDDDEERPTPDSHPETEAFEPSEDARGVAGALRVGFGQVVDDTAPWILLGLVIAALAAPILAEGWLAALPAGLDVLLFAMIGFPTYVCASSATPLVAALMAGGLSPGAAIAFLITGPATNVTTLGVLSSLHGRAAAVRFAGVLVALSVGMGLVLNLFVDLADLGVPSIEALTEETPGALELAFLAILTILVAASVLRVGIRAFAGEVTTGLGAGHTHDHDHAHHHSHHHAHTDDSVTVADSNPDAR